MGFFKKKSVRVAALVTAFALVCCAAYAAVGNMINNNAASKINQNTYLIHENSADEFREINSWAWKVVSMYMMYTKNTLPDSRSLESEMKRIGLTDSSGDLILPVSENYYYSIEINGEKYSNNPEIFSEKADSKYMYESRCDINNNKILTEPEYMEYFYGYIDSNRCYTNNAGMYYYYADGRGIAVYTYDTEGLESYTDDLGAVIYMNSDGTSPVPCIYNDGYSYTSFDADNPLRSENMKIGYSDTARINILPIQKHIDEYEKFKTIRDAAEQKSMRTMVWCIALIALAGLMTVYVVIMGGYNENEGRFLLRFQDRRFGEFHVIAVVLSLGMVYYLYISEFDRIINGFLRHGFGETEVKAGGTAIAGILYLILVFSVDSLLNRLKCRNIKDTFLITETAGKVCSRIKDKIIEFEMMRNDAFTKRFLLRILFAVAAGFTAAVITLFTESILFFVASAVVIVVVYTFSGLKDLEALNKLYENIAKISEGDYTMCIDDRGSVTYSATTNLNRISDGIQNAVDEQLKSERMKIELVTNVSHDLKTPLTSVISYVDLLSREELPPEARDYVSVLEQKTARLKNIVSDVFDLAKATSSTDVNVERIDAVILVRQVLADMEETSRKYEREIKTDIGAESAFIMAEGRKMYRVIQNLIDNALKYSMNGTRIYLKLRAENGKVCINIKNTAAYEMTFTPEEITERFTRGDKSRTTEGSGLGLSIAKSFTEACGGSFSVSTDGDVFAANIEFDVV
ncbi:MAG: HAMP domain-containing histidine kinase [Oscillospiraceae bacterium]|nr:HAMP domain-containing histidine kinase [Oscillospiraceae bacterium]